MLVPKNLIFSQIRSATKSAAALTSTYLIPLTPYFRLCSQKLRHHPGLQREKEQEVDQQRALQ